MWRERPVPPTATAGSPGSGSPVPPKQHFGCTKTFGAVFFGGIKSPCGNGDTHSLGFPHKIDVFSYGKTPGRALGGGKSPCGNGDTHSLVLLTKSMFLATEKPRGVFLGSGKNPCGKHADSHPGFGQGPVSNPARQRHPGDPPGFHQLCLLHAAVSGGTVLAGVRTRCLRGASSVCQPTGQSDDGGPFG